MQRAKEEAFRQKYRQYSGMLYRLGMAYLGTPSDAEDALQEVFFRLLYRAPKFESEEHEKRWLLRVCVNECKNRLTQAKRRQHVPLDESLPGRAAETHGDVLEALLRLDPIYREVVHLHYCEGYGIAAIAEMLRIGASAVKMRLMRARRMLRMELEESDETE